MKEIQLFKIQYKDVEVLQRNAPKFRGYFANKYNEINIMHNHDGEKFIYKYPSIQYKVINNNPMILGIEDGATILKEKSIFLDDKFIIDKRLIESTQKEIISCKVSIGLCKEILKYKFVTPWMALNQENSKKYNELDLIEQNYMLEKILIGNILSLSKGIGYTVEDKIKVKVNVEPIKVMFKDKEMTSFKGNFLANFEIPNHLGIGKSISRGLGTVIRK